MRLVLLVLTVRILALLCLIRVLLSGIVLRAVSVRGIRHTVVLLRLVRILALLRLIGVLLRAVLCGVSREIRIFDRCVRRGVLYRTVVACGGFRVPRTVCTCVVAYDRCGFGGGVHAIVHVLVFSRGIFVLIQIVVFIEFFHTTIPFREERLGRCNRFGFVLLLLFLCAYSILPQCDNHMKSCGNFVEE